MKVLNLGWGIQSFTLAAMVALGELEPIDAAIHADTTHEREATYKFAAKWEPWLAEHGVTVVTVSDYNAANSTFGEKYPNMPATSRAPLFTVNTETGKHGQSFRTCTSRWKIEPIRRWLQMNRNGKNVEQWIGISLDEAERMKPSDVKYITCHWPLIDKRMTRDDCVVWLQRHDLEVPVKSSCVFCPYHNRAAWYEMKRENGADWQKAVEVDEAIRKVRPPFDLFVHSDRIPLTEIKSPQDNGQMDMFSEECSGVCFV